MRLISLRVRGLVSAAKQGLIDWIASKDADIVCLQDIRVREYKIIDDPRFCPSGLSPFYFEGDEEHRGGVAIWTRATPKAVMRGLGGYDVDLDGRYIQADFDTVSIVSVLPPSPWEPDSAAQRQAFMEALAVWMKKTRKKRRHFIFCGDFGIAHRTLDLEEWHKHNESPGFRREDRAWLDEILTQHGYLDAFREVSATEAAYSWFPDQQVFGLANPGGWRTDLQLVSAELKRSIQSAAYVSKRPFDDRAPLIVDYDLDLEPPES